MTIPVGKSCWTDGWFASVASPLDGFEASVMSGEVSCKGVVALVVVGATYYESVYTSSFLLSTGLTDM